ncbi:MAG TPA: DUF4258 domain-containing protein [Anaerolineae bacterium]|nr:DUF4258 domain-containing protein [Anaerolineae bacterium]
MSDWGELLAEIQSRVRAGQYRLSLHGEREREADKITAREIREGLLSPQAEIIENYADDPRGASCLVLGFTNRGDPLHFVCGVSLPDVVVIITLYRPDPKRWIDWRRRR